MAGVNQLLPFANGDVANVIPFADWNSLAARLTGFQSGIASSQQFNYILAQGGSAGYVIGQLVADYTTETATIAATPLYQAFKQAIAAFVPGNIADGSIGTTKIANGSITNAKLANDAVTSAKLADNSVGTEHIQSNAVTADEIAAGAVGTSELATGSVTFPKIASAAIATQQQAEAGTATNVLMTPQRVKQAIDSAFESDLPMASATQLGGVKITGDDGITINEAGEIAVDFSEMPTDKFEDLLKSIRVPIWLSSNKSFYVNRETGSDTIVDGIGESSSKPFKTISACVKYVTDNYNIGTYTAYINISGGTYKEALSFGGYSRSTGNIVLRPLADTGRVTIQNPDVNAITFAIQDGTYTLQDIDVINNVSTSNVVRNSTVVTCLYVNNYASVLCLDCGFYFNVSSTNKPAAFNGRILWGGVFGTLNLQNNTTIKATNSAGYVLNAAFTSGSARIAFFGSDTQTYCYISGDYSNVISTSNAFISANTNGPLSDVIVTTPGGETCTGRRYRAEAGGAIDTVGGGPEFFPGTEAGSVDSSTYSWYK